MNDKVTYHQQFSYCGKPHCRKCREGTGHGPYWYAYQTLDGRTTRTYVGKQLPLDVQAEMEQVRLANTLPALRDNEQAQTTQTRIRIYSLGQMRLERYVNSEWQTVTDASWQHQRVRTLLSCLISTPARKLGREQLMGAVWPDLDSEIASHRLDRAVYSLRQIFEPERNKLATSPLLLTERELLVLADHPLIWLDTDAFEHLIDQAHKNDNPEESERLLEAAATLYGGDFLPDEQQLEWTLARREKLQRLWVSLLTDLADIRIARNALSNAIDPLDRLLSIDPMNESAVQRLMRVLVQLGRRGEALRVYKRLASALHEEYSIAPLPETRSIYEAVRQDATGRATTASNANTATRSNRSNAERSSDNRTIHEPTIQIGRAHQSPLVGREQELAFLRNLIATTEATAKFKIPGQKRTAVTPYDARRRPQSVLLMGDVGIGKTRLAEEMSREARKRGWAIAWSRVYAQESSIPYRLWIEVLRKSMEQSRYAGATLATANTPTMQIALPPHIAQRPNFYQPLSTLLPELHSMLPDMPSAAVPLPEQEQHRLWEAARELLTSISGGIPLLIVLDDLQWADASSCELLAYLARHIQGYPIIIIGTCRDSELTATSPLRPLMVDLQREYAMETLSLSPLSDEQISILVSAILTRGQPTEAATSSEPGLIVVSDTATPSSATSMSASIQTRAAGNPFFAEELARTLATLSASALLPATVSIANSINSTNGPSGLHGLNGNQNALPILPETITAVLDLRMGRLSTACRRLLSKAAVLGGSFEFPIISAMEATTPGSDEDTILELIEEALHMGMLTEEGIGTRITYQFWHPLLASHLYESLSAARRASLHRRAAEVLLHAFTSREEEAAATIVHHLVNGGADADQITHYAELAGDRAYALSAYPDAEKYYRLTLASISQHPDEQLHRADISELLGECINIQGNYEEARHYYEHALALRSQQRTTTISQPEIQLQALLWCEIGLTWYNTSDNTRAQQCYEHGEQLLLIANVISGPAWARLRYEQSYAYWLEGNYSKAQNKANEAFELFKQYLEQQKSTNKQTIRPTRIRRTLAGDMVDLGRTQMLLGLIANGAGHSHAALEHLNAALALYEQHNCQRELAIASCNLGDVYLRVAQYSPAQAVLRQSLSITERIGDIPNMSYAIGNMGVLDIRIGNLVDAENELRRSLTLSERIDDPVFMSILYAYLAISLQEQGKLSEASSMLQRALTTGRASHIAPYIGLTMVFIGNLRIAQANITYNSSENETNSEERKKHLLHQAKKTLEHALRYEGMEAETKIEGQLALARAFLLLNETQQAYQLALQTLEEAQKLELAWLVACTQRILGSILVAKGEYEPATKYFEQAIKTLRRCGMRLEYARALQHYGQLLIQQESPESKPYQRGLAYLQEAKQIFSTLQAQIDLQSLERILPS